MYFLGGSATSVDEKSEYQAHLFRISDPFPNPFNSGVSFDIEADNGHKVTVDVFNILGRRIFHWELKRANVWTFSFGDLELARDEISSGLYFFKFSWRGESIIRKALLLK
jgi:hypothetical protein